MLKIRNSKVKLFGIITCLSLLSISYLGLTFYSVPEKVSATEASIETRGLSDITYMQDMTAEICTNAQKNESKALQDKRDGSTYVVQKLEDNNCWMLQNLKLTKEGIEQWKSKNPDVENNVQLSNKYSNVAANSTFSMPATLTSTAGFNGAHEDITPKVYNGPYKSGATDNNKWQEGYGAYYNWYAVTAGTGTYVNVANQEASGSICPKGWQLPTAYENDTSATKYNYSFNQLIIDPLTGKPYAMSNDANYKNNAWRDANYTDMTLGLTNASGAVFSGGFFSAAGVITNNSLFYVGSDGSYWSNTVRSATHIRTLGFSGTWLLPDSGDFRSSGNSVRCVAPSILFTSTQDTGLQVLVNPYLTIEATSGMTETMGTENILHGNISATVAANGEYNVMLSAEQPDLKDPDNTDFPGIPASPDVAANNNAWGIQNKDAATYKAVTTTAQIFDSIDTFDEVIKSTTHTYTVGVSVSPSIPAGKYSTTVTVTAVGK